MILRLLPRRAYSVPLRYAASAVIVLIAAMLRFSLEGPLQHYPLLLFIPAVFLCALLFDKGSGFFATIFSAVLAAYLFIEPRFSLAIQWTDLTAMAIFVAVGFTMAAVVEALRKTVRRLEEAEKAKALLLEELAHRTKNDLAIISSAITLQARAASDPLVREALDAANARVQVVASAQERLKGDIDGGQVDLATYIEGLCSGLGDLLRDVRPIAVRVRCDPIRVASSGAVHVGLIVNELVTNSFKYAYPGERGGTVQVDIGEEDERIRIVVSDDGVGCPAAVQAGLGSRLVRLLAQQRGGSVEREAGDPGCRVRVVLDEAGLVIRDNGPPRRRR